MIPHENVKRILVDARNIKEIMPKLRAFCDVRSNLIGFDIETSQRDMHDGLKKLMKIDDEGFSHNQKLIFDFKRTKITGCSWYFGRNDQENVYYFNFRHADDENRVSLEYLFMMMDAIKAAESSLIIHNAQYERSVFKGAYDYDLPNSFCSMQLCVTAYNPDEYRHSDLPLAIAKGIRPLIPDIERLFNDIEDGELSFKQWEVLNKFIDKTSKSAHSYNGIVKDIAFGYGLKKAVKSWFNYKMIEFKDVLADKPDMEALTGAEVLDYGCDDAYWCYQLFMKVYNDLKIRNPNVIQSYINTENPITQVFSDCTVAGMRVNLPEIHRIRDLKRIEVANTLVEMKKVLREIMPTTLPPLHEKLLKYEKWYKPESNIKYFNLLHDWLKKPDDLEPFDICTQIKCATANAWYQEKLNTHKDPPVSLSLNHYMAMRYVLFVICGLELKVDQGKVQSDKAARAEMGDHPILALYKTLGDIEQGMKLYNTPYIYMTDPETLKMHPIMSSTLATRRTSCQHPNAQQLQKRGESTYVRGYYQADNEDELIVSADWSAIELCGVGAFSQDPVFLKAYSQRPHDDLHSEAAAGVLGLPLEVFVKLPDKKVKRTEFGKTSNFEYWYSGWLAQTQKRAGWSFEQTAEAVNGYRAKFAVGEKWRVGVIDTVVRKGQVVLPDHHTRTRYEATEEWAMVMHQTFAGFGSPALMKYCAHAIKAIQRRAGNQAVNALIQGTCGALAKQRILAINSKIKELGFRARFMLLIHDELLFSVHKDDVAKFCDFLYAEMIADSPMFPNIALDSSIAIGYTFQPYHPEHAKFGQIELMEMNKGLACIAEDRWEKAASNDERQAIIDYLVKRAA